MPIEDVEINSEISLMFISFLALGGDVFLNSIKSYCPKKGYFFNH